MEPFIRTEGQRFGIGPYSFRWIDTDIKAGESAGAFELNGPRSPAAGTLFGNNATVLHHGLSPHPGGDGHRSLHEQHGGLTQIDVGIRIAGKVHGGIRTAESICSRNDVPDDLSIVAVAADIFSVTIQRPISHETCCQICLCGDWKNGSRQSNR